MWENIDFGIETIQIKVSNQKQRTQFKKEFIINLLKAFPVSKYGMLFSSPTRW